MTGWDACFRMQACTCAEMAAVPEDLTLARNVPVSRDGAESITTREHMEGLQGRHQTATLILLTSPLSLQPELFGSTLATFQTDQFYSGSLDSQNLAESQLASPLGVHADVSQDVTTICSNPAED